MPERKMAENDDYLEAVKGAYLLLEENFDALHAHCKTAADRELLKQLHAQARDAYWKAAEAAFADGNELVRELHQDLTRATQELRDMLANMQKVDALLALARQTVRLAGSLVSMALA